MNLTIEEKLALIHKMKNIPIQNEREKKKVHKKNVVAFFFLRLSLCVVICGILYILFIQNESFKNVLYQIFTSQSKINLIDFFSPFKYTFMR